MNVTVGEKAIEIREKAPASWVIWNIGDHTPDGVVIFGKRESENKNDMEYFHLVEFCAIKVTDAERELLLHCGMHGIDNRFSKIPKREKYGMTVEQAEKAIEILKRIQS